MTNKVIFVDIDGPMIPVRAYRLKKQTKPAEVFDPCAVAMLLSLLEESDAKMVVSSTWGGHGKVVCNRLFRKNGIDPKKYFHSDWVTPRLYTFSGGSRTSEIANWLKSHPEVTAYAALDDETLDYNVLPGHVQCDTYEGFSYRNYLECRVLLDCFESDVERERALSHIDFAKKKEIWRTKRKNEPGFHVVGEAVELIFPRILPNEDNF